jgi:hypothetical protein
LLNGYLIEEGKFEVQVSEPVSQMPSPVEKNQAFKSEQSSDDLRTGLFQYIQDAGKYRSFNMTVYVHMHMCVLMHVHQVAYQDHLKSHSCLQYKNNTLQFSLS